MATEEKLGIFDFGGVKVNCRTFDDCHTPDLESRIRAYEEFLMFIGKKLYEVGFVMQHPLEQRPNSEIVIFLKSFEDGSYKQNPAYIALPSAESEIGIHSQKYRRIGGSVFFDDEEDYDIYDDSGDETEEEEFVRK